MQSQCSKIVNSWYIAGCHKFWPESPIYLKRPEGILVSGRICLLFCCLSCMHLSIVPCMCWDIYTCDVIVSIPAVATETIQIQQLKDWFYSPYCFWQIWVWVAYCFPANRQESGWFQGFCKCHCDQWIVIWNTSYTHGYTK